MSSRTPNANEADDRTGNTFFIDRPRTIPGQPCRRICRNVRPFNRRRCVNFCRRILGRRPLSPELGEMSIEDDRDEQTSHLDGFDFLDELR